MKTYTKRLVVKQRKTLAETQAVMNKVINRYLTKMSNRGWKRADVTEFAGNCFLEYEHVLTMQK